MSATTEEGWSGIKADVDSPRAALFRRVTSQRADAVRRTSSRTQRSVCDVRKSISTIVRRHGERCDATLGDVSQCSPWRWSVRTSNTERGTASLIVTDFRKHGASRYTVSTCVVVFACAVSHVESPAVHYADEEVDILRACVRNFRRGVEPTPSARDREGRRPERNARPLVV